MAGLINLKRKNPPIKEQILSSHDLFLVKSKSWNKLGNFSYNNGIHIFRNEETLCWSITNKFKMCDQYIYRLIYFTYHCQLFHSEANPSNSKRNFFDGTFHNI